MDIPDIVTSQRRLGALLQAAQALSVDRAQFDFNGDDALFVTHAPSLSWLHSR
jgi:hypothetical protein